MKFIKRHFVTLAVVCVSLSTVISWGNPVLRIIFMLPNLLSGIAVAFVIRFKSMGFGAEESFDLAAEKFLDFFRGFVE